MKKLLFIALLFIAIIGCKKEEANKLPNTTEVNYQFFTGGTLSKIVYTSIGENKTITITNANTNPGPSNTYPPYKITDFVKAGDHIHLEMSTQNKVNEYMIAVTLAKSVKYGTTDYSLGSNSTLTKDNSGNNIIIYDKTFTEAELAN